MRLHGTFILSTVEGVEAIAAEERYQRLPEEERQYRQAATDLANSLQGKPAIIDPAAAAVVRDAADLIGQGANLERSGVVGTGVVQNVAIALTCVATVATLTAVSGLALGAGGAVLAALVAGEPLKKSKPFIHLTGIVTQKIDAAGQAEISELARRLARHRIFVESIEPGLRSLARSNRHFSWLDATLDWLKRSGRNVPPGGDDRG